MPQNESWRWLRRPAGTTPRIAFGADYNPDQWPRRVWDEDVKIMRAAGVDVVSVAIFSWARLQPDEDSWDFAWLDEVMDLMHAAGIGVDLATATASPPPWLSTRHPEILPVNRLGQTIGPGARQHWRPTSPVFRRYALGLVRALAERYAGHPALVAWHVSNELGCHNVYDYSDDAAAAFRTWLAGRYGTIDALNHAWGTAFWSQRYGGWAEILPPRLAASHPNPTQQLDFRRFSSDVLLDYLRAERDVLREITPDVPVTTNFMVMDGQQAMDYAAWAGDVDFVANDHYVRPGPQAVDELSFSANLTGQLARRRPWFLMEHSTSAVNWQPVNVAKRPGELARDALLHVAHGADAVCYFQWRQSAAGAEKYHSAMVPHSGTDTAVHRAVVALGQTLADLAPVVGSEQAPARAAILFDWESWWAVEADSHPTSRLRYRREALDWYSAFLALGVRADVVPVSAGWDGYDLVVAPILHMVPAPLRQRLERYVEGGGHLVATYFSGTVDENDHVLLGGYPGALRDLLGIRVQEFRPLLDEEAVTLDVGAAGTMWTEHVDVVDPAVEVWARYTSGETAGLPAVTHRPVPGGGSAGYVSTRLGADGLPGLLRRFVSVAGIGHELPAGVRGLVQLVVRRGPDAEFWFLVNRTADRVEVPDVAGDVLVGRRSTGDVSPVVLEPREVAVLRRPAS